MKNLTSITAAKLHDQDGNIVYQVMFEGRSGYLREGELSASKSPLSALAERLGLQGLHLVSPAQRSAAMRAVETSEVTIDKIKLANRPGWLDTETYVHGLGVGITAGVDDPSVVPLFAPLERYKPSGSHEAWVAALDTPMANQHLLQAIACFAVTPVVLRLFGHLADVSGNFGLELTGRTSLGKTTALRLAASVWGKPEGGSEGYLQTWRVTENGFEPLLQDHCDAVLPLDEANLAGLTARARDELQGHAVFLLDTGTEKTRKNQAPKRSSRLVFLSSSNVSLSDPGSRHADVSSALRVRMPAINLNSRTYGILDTAGPDGAAKAIETIHQAIATNNGHAGLIFVRYITKNLHDDRAALESKISNLIKQFKTKAKYDARSSESQRICNAFALVYAAGCLARDCGALPGSWKEIGKSVMSTYQLAVANCRLTPVERALAFQDHLSALKDQILLLPLQSQVPPTTVGFIKSARVGLELIIRPTAYVTHLSKFQDTLEELTDCGCMVRDGQRTTTYRSISQDCPPERVHVFRLKPGSKPGHILFARTGL